MARIGASFAADASFGVSVAARGSCHRGGRRNGLVRGRIWTARRSLADRPDRRLLRRSTVPSAGNALSMPGAFTKVTSTGKGSSGQLRFNITMRQNSSHDPTVHLRDQQPVTVLREHSRDPDSVVDPRALNKRNSRLQSICPMSCCPNRIGQRIVEDGPDPAQRMPCRDALLGGAVAELQFRRRVRATPRHLRPCRGGEKRMTDRHRCGGAAVAPGQTRRSAMTFGIKCRSSPCLLHALWGKAVHPLPGPADFWSGQPPETPQNLCEWGTARPASAGAGEIRCSA